MLTFLSKSSNLPGQSVVTLMKPRMIKVHIDAEEQKNVKETEFAQKRSTAMEKVGAQKLAKKKRHHHRGTLTYKIATLMKV